MAYEYTELSVEDRAEIARGQVAQFERELFSHELNQSRAEALPVDTPGRAEQIKASTDAQTVILSALETTKTVSADLAVEVQAVEVAASPATVA